MRNKPISTLATGALSNSQLKRHCSSERYRFVPFGKRQAETFLATVGLLLLSPGVTADSEQWEFIGPDSSRVNAIAAGHQAVVYLANRNGLFRSEDAGETWIEIPPTRLCSAPQIVNLAIDPSEPFRIYAATSNGLFVAEHPEYAWARLGEDAFPVRGVRNVFVSPHGDGALFAISISVYWRRDASATWQEVFADDDATIGFSSRRDRVFAGTYEGFLLSTDGGQSFETVSPIAGATILRFDPSSGTLYGSALRGLRRSFLHISKDEGHSWGLTADFQGGRPGPEGLLPPTVIDIAVDPRNGDVYVATAKDRIFRSVDQGQSWEWLGEALPERLSSLTRSQGHGSPRYLYVATDEGAYRRQLRQAGRDREERPDFGYQAHFSSTGPTERATATLEVGVGVFAVIPHQARPNVIYAGTSSGAVYKRSEDGHWSRHTNGLPRAAMHVLQADPTDGDVLYAGLRGAAGIFRTVDGGQTWQPANGNAIHSSVFAIGVDPTNSKTLFAGLRTALVKSTDSGESWRMVLREPTEFTSIAFSPARPEVVYAGSWQYLQSDGRKTGTNGLYRSDDSGDTWHKVSEEALTRLIASKQDPDLLYAVQQPRELGLQDRRQVVVSQDGGRTWTSITNHLPGNQLAFDEIVTGNSDDTLYAARDTLVFMSSDGGQSWHPYGVVLQGSHINAIAITDNAGTVALATERGVFVEGGIETHSTHAIPEPDRWTSPASQQVADTLWTLAGCPPWLLFRYRRTLLCWPGFTILRREPGGRWVDIGIAWDEHGL